jgi:hypothetical protein
MKKFIKYIAIFNFIIIFNSIIIAENNAIKLGIRNTKTNDNEGISFFSPEISYSKYFNNIEISASLIISPNMPTKNYKVFNSEILKSNIMYNYILTINTYISYGISIGILNFNDFVSTTNSGNIEFNYKNFIIEYEYMYLWKKLYFNKSYNNLISNSIILKYRWIF